VFPESTHPEIVNNKSRNSVVTVQTMKAYRQVEAVHSH